MDKHIYACDSSGCIMENGFVYLHIEPEDRILWGDSTNVDCPVCHEPLRLIESIFEGKSED